MALTAGRPATGMVPPAALTGQVRSGQLAGADRSGQVRSACLQVRPGQAIKLTGHRSGQVKMALKCSRNRSISSKRDIKVVHVLCVHTN
jgi:hypothetical protein